MTDQPPPAADDQARLDELVPRPWSAGRRMQALAVGLALVAGLLAIVISGAAGPRLTHEDGWGSGVTRLDGQPRITVERLTPITNSGWLPVTLESLELPAIDGVSWGEVPGLPLILEPGETHELRVPFEAEGCDLDVGGYDVFPIRATSGFAPSRVVEVPAPFSEPWEGPATFVGADGTETRIPGFPEQPPSWIVDTLADTCRTPPGDGA